MQPGLGKGLYWSVNAARARQGIVQECECSQG